MPRITRLRRSHSISCVVSTQRSTTPTRRLGSVKVWSQGTPTGDCLLAELCLAGGSLRLDIRIPPDAPVHGGDAGQRRPRRPRFRQRTRVPAPSMCARRAEAPDQSTRHSPQAAHAIHRPAAHSKRCAFRRNAPPRVRGSSEAVGGGFERGQ